VKILAGLLCALIVLIQYPLWLGKGGWLRAWDMNRELAAQRARNDGLALRNAALAAEVRDLKQGYEAIEERARAELGMVRQDEVFFQYVDRPPDAFPGEPSGAAAAPGDSTPTPARR
jgi:cell division protein FtsB